MPVTFRIFPKKNLVYARYSGFAGTEETILAFQEAASHPDSHPSQNHMVDLAKITGFDNNFVQMMEFQAQQADHFMRSERAPILLFYAPSEMAQRMAFRGVRAWEKLGGIVPMVVPELNEALHILGLDKAFLQEVDLAFA